MSESAPFIKGNANSMAAAERIRPYLKTSRYQIWRFIGDNPACSDHDIVSGTGIKKNTVRPRRIELEARGHIEPCGVDPNNTGRTLYRVTNKPYPEDPPRNYWTSTMREVRAARPTPVEIGHFLQNIDLAVETKVAQKVRQWLLVQSETPPDDYNPNPDDEPVEEYLDENELAEVADFAEH